MGAVEDKDLILGDLALLRSGGGIARTPAHYEAISTAWDIRPLGEPPHATVIRAWRGERVFIVESTGTPVSIRREHRHLNIYKDGVMVVLPYSGTVAIEQAGHSLEVSPGEVGSVCFSETFEVISHPGMRVNLLYLPGRWLNHRGFRSGTLLAQKWSRRPLISALSVLSREIIANSAKATTSAVENALFEILISLFSFEPVEGRRRTTDEERRVLLDELISRRFTDPLLSPEKLAVELGISRRTLYNLVGQQDITVSQMIRARRVYHARFLLETQPVLSMVAVANMCGFRGPDQLARAFKSETGVAPSIHRHQGGRHLLPSSTE